MIRGEFFSGKRLLAAYVSAMILPAVCAVPAAASGQEAMSYMLDQYNNSKVCDGHTVCESSYSLPVFSGNGPSISSLNARVDEIRSAFRETEADLFSSAEERYRNSGAVDPLSVTYTTEESFHQGDYRTLLIESYYYGGGPHGYTGDEYMNLDIVQGRQLALSDVTDTGEEEFEALLRDVIRNSQEYAGLFDSPETITEERSMADYHWSFLPEGVGIHFSQYEIAPYAVGMPCFVIPYGSLSMKIDPAGASPGPEAQTETVRQEMIEAPAEKEEAAGTGGDSTEIHRYSIVIGDITWEQARKKTLADGGHLARLNTPAEYEAVTAQADAEGKGDYYLFIGGHRDNQNVYHWIDDNGGFFSEDLTAPGSWYASVWMENEPSYYDPERKTNTGEVLQEACLVLKKYQGRWVLNDVPGDLVGSYDGWLAGKVGYVAEYD